MMSTRTAPSARGAQRGTRHGAFSPTAGIAHAVVIKDGDVFFLSGRDGAVPGGRHGVGLYYHDCRYLNRCELLLAGRHGTPLAATAVDGFRSLTELTNEEIRTDDDCIPAENLGIMWERTVDAATPALRGQIRVHNFGVERVDVPLSLTWGSAFEDVFAVRGMPSAKRGTLQRPAWHGGLLLFVYDGADDVRRSLAIELHPAPATTSDTTAHYRLAIEPGAAAEITTALVIAESQSGEAGAPSPRVPLHRAARRGARADGLASYTELRTPSVLLKSVVDRSLTDLTILRSEQHGHTFFAAGVPWYVALFGRDTIVAALETLAWDASMAEHTLRLLASYQGRRTDAWRDEEPGKIPHELRVGEMARLHEIPQTPYYGSVDATPLFLILLARHAAWTGQLRVFRELRDHVEAAVQWLARAARDDAGGYVAYTGSTGKGLVNQGWKDSGDCIVNADGTSARPPIALVEVQGYAWMARHGLADLYERDGDRARATALRDHADDLRTRFNRDFWADGLATYALAVQHGGARADVVSSNAGQALWSGIADAQYARRTAERLMADDMFTGWGIRTLSSRERRYNPIGYHVGTVWPHDNALIAAGFRRYGFDADALRIFRGILSAAMHFEHNRLPEVFAGFTRQEYETPVHYPVACHPQAWAAAAVPYLLESCLGLVPHAFEHRLSIVRPVLPDFVNELELHRLRVGDACTDLRFERGSDGSLSVNVLRVDGRLDVVVEARS